jgi:hypothetical protein
MAIVTNPVQVYKIPLHKLNILQNSMTVNCVLKKIQIFIQLKRVGVARNVARKGIREMATKYECQNPKASAHPGDPSVFGEVNSGAAR